jgi:hypothetical protein
MHTPREIEAMIERVNERVVREKGRDLLPFERQQMRQELTAIFGPRTPWTIYRATTVASTQPRA